MATPTRRQLLAALGGTAALAGCTGAPSNGDGAPDTPAGADVAFGPDDAGDGVPTADRSLPADYTLADLTDHMRSGGPPKDGIPSIDDPQFTTADDPPSILAAGDPVFGVAVDGHATAYPQSVLVWHEIVNDTIAGTPVAVTYCPLTGTAQGFFRGDVEFGVSGRLINANLVMYDRATDSFWSQILARAVTDPHAGDYLREFRLVWTTWQRWREAHPDTRVLTTETGFARDYGGDPYGAYNPTAGYYADENTLFPPLARDDRFHPKAVVLGSRTTDGALAVPTAALREQSVVTGGLDGTPYVTVYDDTLDTGYVYRNPDDRAVTATGDGYDVAGETHQPAALPLDRQLAFDAMWFAWYGYYPSTTVHE